MCIGAPHPVMTCKSADQHQQCRARQVKIGEQAVDDPKLEAGSDKQRGLAIPRRKPTGPKCGRFECAQRCRADGDHGTAAGTRRGNRADRRCIEAVVLGMHLVEGQIFVLHGRKRTGANVKCDKGSLDTTGGQCGKSRVVEMQTRRGGRHRTGGARVDRLIAFRVRCIRRPPDVRRQRNLAIGVQPGQQRTRVVEADKMETIVAVLHDGRRAARKLQWGSRAWGMTRPHLHPRFIRAGDPFEQDLDFAAGGLVRADTRLDHPRVVADDEIARLQQRRQVGEIAIGVTVHTDVEQSTARTLHGRRLRDQFRRQRVVEIGQRIGARHRGAQWIPREGEVPNALGAGRGTRTPTIFLPADFESATSTSSVIPAIALRSGHVPIALPEHGKGGIIAKKPLPCRAFAVRRSAVNTVRNILFIMCDQLRRDHLSCYGGRVPTPNLDALAARGVRFDHAYVQSGVCGPSRMSYYTGRYMSSHGATWNRVPLSAAQPTFGDHLQAAGRIIALAGKTHVLPDDAGCRRFGIAAESTRGVRLRAGGFVEIDRYDGHMPPGPESGYAQWLRARGYRGKDPWSEHVIAVEDGGRVRSGWQMRNVHLPARVRAEHSESPYMTGVALDWIAAQGETPWALHLSYVKPHWPYVAPAPWHAMFRGGDTGTIVRSPQDGTADEHPVMHAYRQHDECLSFAREDVARHVRPAYMGLIAQVDAEIGRLVAVLEQSGRMRDTLIIFTADHGEFLGDRGLGEKELLFDEVVRVPFIVVDPDPLADATRGSVDGRFVEAIDVVPTCLDALALPVPAHQIEGRSLVPLLRGGGNGTWRDCAISELDYGYRRARLVLGRGVQECRAIMVRTSEWKYVYWQGFRPQLFDMERDPQELIDLGAAPSHDAVRAAMHARIVDWMIRRHVRTTVSDEDVATRTDVHRRHGIDIGIW